MTDLARLLPHVTAFPHALGCGIIVRSAMPIDGRLHGRLATFIGAYERTLSRFRADSTVARLARGGGASDAAGPHGGAASGVSATFPAWTRGLFALADRLTAATDGAIDPCVGETMVRLGYGIALGRAFRGETTEAEPAAGTGIGRTGGMQPADVGSETRAARPHSWDELDAETVERPRWDRDVRWGTGGRPAHGAHGDGEGAAGTRGEAGKGDKAAQADADAAAADADVTLTARRPVLLDFGAFGKGYLVDLLTDMLRSAGLGGPLVIDAGGDLRIEALQDPPLRIGLEDPADPTRALGVAEIGEGSLCASSPSRRHWAGAHHLVNALDGRPADDVAAAWTFVRHGTMVPAYGSADRAGATETGLPPWHGAHATRVVELVRHFPTAVADGLATALFVADPTVLRDEFPYDCALLCADRTARMSAGFPGTLFLR